MFYDRLVQYANRFKLTKVSGTDDTYDFQRVEGIVTQEGTKLNAEKLNTLVDIETLETYWKNKIDIEYPVGEGFIVTLTNVNPSTKYTWQTWVQVGQGRALTGVGTGTDKNNVTKTFTEGNNDGEYEHIQTIEELAEHTHDYVKNGEKNFVTVSASDTKGTSGNTTVQTSSTGKGQAMNVVTPSFGVYFWKRTA